MSRRRRDDWSASALPGIRRAFERALSERAERLAVADPSFFEGMFRDMPVSAAEYGDFVRDSAQQRAWSARVSELYWVTLDMAKVALDASTDIPAIDLATALPAHHGIIAFSAPLPPVPWDGDPSDLRDEEMRDVLTQPAPTDAIAWTRLRQGGYVLTPLSRSRRQRQSPMVVGPFVEGNAPHVSGTDADLEERPTARALSAFLQAAFTLMAMPTVAEIRDIDPRTGETKGRPSAPSGPRGPQDVRIIDLRPMRHVRLEGDAPTSGGRTYRHRWMVRGHWRQQAVGPKRGQHRTTWIPSYIKGPEGAPMLDAEQVMVWRR